MERCKENFGKTLHGHVWGQLSQKLDFSFL